VFPLPSGQKVASKGWQHTIVTRGQSVDGYRRDWLAAPPESSGSGWSNTPGE
jgi:hypothetical protein